MNYFLNMQFLSDKTCKCMKKPFASVFPNAIIGFFYNKIAEGPVKSLKARGNRVYHLKWIYVKTDLNSPEISFMIESLQRTDKKLFDF